MGVLAKITIEAIKNMTYEDISRMGKDELFKTLRYAKQQTDKRLTNYMKAKEKDKTLYARTLENFIENKKGARKRVPMLDEHGNQRYTKSGKPMTRETEEVKFKGRLKANKKMSVNDMRSELIRAQKVFKSKSGTTRGAKEIRKDQIMRLAEEIGDDNKMLSKLSEKTGKPIHKIISDRTLNSQTGWTEQQQGLIDVMKEWDKDTWKEYWETYNRFMDEHPSTSDSNQVQKEILKQFVMKKSRNEIIETVAKNLGYIMPFS